MEKEMEHVIPGSNTKERRKHHKRHSKKKKKKKQRKSKSKLAIKVVNDPEPQTLIQEVHNAPMEVEIKETPNMFIQNVSMAPDGLYNAELKLKKHKKKRSKENKKKQQAIALHTNNDNEWQMYSDIGEKRNQKQLMKVAKIRELGPQFAETIQEPMEEVFRETPMKYIKRCAVGRIQKQSLPSGYRICDAELNFNLDCSGPIRHIPPPSYSKNNLVIPKLMRKRARPINKPKPAETPKEVQPKEQEEIKTEPLLECNLKPIVKTEKIMAKSVNLVGIPTSEELWESYENWKNGGEAVWPICCQQNVIPNAQESIATKTIPIASTEIEISEEEQLQQAVSWLTDSVNWSEWPKKVEEEASFDNMSFLEMDSLELSLDEERSVSDCLKTKGLHTPMSEIREYDMLLAMARTEESRRTLHELVKSRIIEHMKQEKQCNCLQKALAINENPQTTTQTEPNTAKEPTQGEQSNREVTSEAVKMDVTPIVVDNTNAAKLQKAISALIELPQQQQIEKSKSQLLDEKKNRDERPVILNVEQLISRPPAGKPQAIFCVPSTVQEKPKNNVITSIICPIDFETEIGQIKQQLLPPKQLQPFNAETSTENVAQKSAQATGKQPQDVNKWEGSFRQRLEGFNDIIDQNMTEFSDPQAKRLRTKRIHESGVANLDHLKRILLMPELLSPVEQGLRKIGILRSTKRKVERETLQIEVKIVKAYSTVKMQLDLDLSQLALKLDNAVYNSKTEVLMKHYEAGQMAWIWDNGSMLISNARSKLVLTETEENLMAKILELTQSQSQSSSSTEPHKSQSHMISFAQLPWQISFEGFCQSQALNFELVGGGGKYAYYVNRSIPSVAAKLFESGIVHVYAITPAETDRMLEKLYLLTSNHRKPSVTTIQSSSKPNSNGTFISLFPHSKTD